MLNSVQCQSLQLSRCANLSLCIAKYGVSMQSCSCTADVKNKRSGQKTGKKITGMQFLASDTSKLLITSNDSRIRLYDGTPSVPVVMH